MNNLSYHWFLRRYYFRKLKEKFMLWFVWKLPKTLIYWCAIRLIAFATTGKYSSQTVPDLTAMDALKRFEVK